MKPGIYEAFDSAFKRVAAFAILADGRAIGRVAVKYPADGMGRATFYLQAWGVEMVKGSAAGCGYDKTTAAAHNAGAALAKVAAACRAETARETDGRALAHAESIARALVGEGDNGVRWDSRLQAAGYTVAGVI